MSKICFIFPGQGAQQIGMGKSLYDAYDEVKNIYDSAEKVTGKPLKDISFNGPDDELNKTENSQLALLVSSFAAYNIFKHYYNFNIENVVFGGLSLGEYSAFAAAEVLTFEDTLRIVKKRSFLMQDACEKKDGAMCSIIGLSYEKTLELCNSIPGYLTIANLNCPGQIVISGDKKSIIEASVKAKEMGAKLAIVLKVAGAFHSAHMKEASNEFKEFIKDIKINRGNLHRVLSNVTGTFFNSNDDIISLMSMQITNSVLWEKNIITAINSGVNLFYECGAGKTLSGMLKRTDKTKQCINIETKEDIDNIKKT